MKKLLPILSLSFLTLAACNQSNTAEQPVVQSAQQVSAQPDTIGLAAYQAWKAQNELAPVAASYAQNAVQPAQPQEPKTRVIYRTVPEKRSVAKAPVRSSSKSSTTAPASSGSADEGSGSISNESAQTAKVEEKKKMSAQTKGTIIGAAGGAAAGAIINKKNRVVGAVIGGVAGAIGGGVIGGKIDQKNGR